MKESAVQNLIRMFMSSIGIVNWRNNVGTGWAGKTIHIKKRGSVYLEHGDVVVKNARPLHSGLCKGSSDVIGITPVLIDEAMVGKIIGVFTAVEIKTNKGRPSKEQQNYIDAVKAAGGYAGIARCNEDIDEIIQRY